MAGEITDITLHRGLEQVLIDEERLRARVEALGAEIAAYYGDRCPMLIGVLTGGFLFMADLIRAMRIPLHVEFMAVSSYGAATVSTGVVRILKDLDRPIEDQHVLLVEDIIDSGLTLNYLIEVLRQRKPAEIRLVTLLNKVRLREVDVRPDWTGFDIPDEFVVGYGLDVAGKYRNLPFIAVAGADATGGA